MLQAVSQLQQVPGKASVLQLAAALDSHSATLAASLPSLVAAAALRLHEAASRLLPGCFEDADAQLPGVLSVLRGTHAALQHSDHSDGVLRGCVALRLALVLEQHGQLVQALAVAEQGLAAVVAARCEALTDLRGQQDEHVRWMSGARTQDDDATAVLMQGGACCCPVPRSC